METAVIAPILVALIMWFVRCGNKALTKHDQAHQLLQEANLYQIKAKLLTMYRDAKIEGRTNTHEMDVFNGLYQVYQKLGGNSFMDTIREKMNELEIIDD